MIINKETYALEESNYIKIESIKKQIVIANTFNHDMKHVIGWKKRHNGNYKKTAAFTIDAAGVVYNHFDPIFQSKYFGNVDLDTKSIVILIENDGWLFNDSEKNIFITWIGNIYNKPKEIFEKRWRGYTHWANYTKEQFDSCVSLTKMLCDEFYIPNNVVSHNTKIDGVLDFNGVLYKSNIEKYYTDISPAWDFEQFKNKMELI
jgi:N-acetyl-anhydromuramyl-L-alanine amidase AmpD